MTVYSSEVRPVRVDQMQAFARTLIVGLRTEVRHIDDEGIALPVAARIAIPLADAGRQVWASIHNNVALPTLALTHIVEDRDAAWRLHDAAEAVASNARQAAGQAALRQRSLLRTVMAIHAARRCSE